MGQFLALTFTGLSMGMVYAMLAVGLLLLLRAVGVMNFAQGMLLALGAYTAYYLVTLHGLSLWIAIPIMIVFLAAFGAVFMFTCYYPTRNNPFKDGVMVCTIGASMIIEELCMIVSGSKFGMLPALLDGSLIIGDFVLRKQYIAIFCVCALIMALVWLLFDKLYAGRAMQAAAQNSYAARLIGIPSLITVLFTYIIVVEVAGFAGYLVAPVFLVRTTLSAIQQKAFAGIVLGGFGSIKGAFLGCLLIGLIESYSVYFTTVYKDVFVFGALLLVLAIKPSGLLGASVGYQDKA